MGERPTPDAPQLGKRRPPQAPSSRLHSAQSQLARVRAVGLVTGPDAHTPRTHGRWVAGPGCTPQGRAVGRGRAPNPGRPTPRQETPLPRAPSCLQSAQRELARAPAEGSVTGPRAHIRPTHSLWVAGPGRTSQGRAVGRGRAPQPGRPTSREETPPPGTLVPPPQRPKPAGKSAGCGVGNGSPRPPPPAPTASG